MSAVQLPTYRFGGYTFREATSADVALAWIWNLADPDHTWELQFPRYWIEQSKGANSYVLEDTEGTVFFVKSIRQPYAEIEVSLQFDRSEKQVSRRRAIAAMQVGFAWLKKALPMNSFRAVYFATKNERLGQFAVKSLGFMQDGERYVYRLDKEEENGKTYSEGTQGNSHQQVRRPGSFLPGPGQESRKKCAGAGRQQIAVSEEARGCEGASRLAQHRRRGRAQGGREA